MADVHLILTEGVTLQCLMHGEISLDKAKKLYREFKKKGFKVEKEVSPLPGKRNSL